ncbi:SRPBCC family protein [Catenuloplanes japonicus]|uniref:hypothetical protein n=1 Tax=Catenuloplanes japonicus TaxID=33876 RepID=UPI00052444CE|nr:hypothetical protein [Catenuloplanes japonicus]
MTDADPALPVRATVDVRIPVAEFWDVFRQARLWPRWNSCFHLVGNRDLTAGRRLFWTFRPIRPGYLYRMPAVADIVEVAAPYRVAWHVTALPGFFARHVYTLEDLGDGVTRFGSWETASGPAYRAARRFWVAHFEFVRDRSMAGAVLLEQHYRETGRLTAAGLSRASLRRSPPGAGG